MGVARLSKLRTDTAQLGNALFNNRQSERSTSDEHRTLNKSEMSTLLAALRLWQRELCRSGLPEWADEYFRDCEQLLS